MLGAWYVVAVIPTPFEKNAFNPKEAYTWNEKGHIDVDFTFNVGKVDGPVKSIPQKLYTPSYPLSSGKWQASPFKPIKLDYTIMDLASDYSWVLVGHSSRKWLWVMARETSLDEKIVSQCLNKAENEGFDIKKVEIPEHGQALI